MDEVGADRDPGKYTMFVGLTYESGGGPKRRSKVSSPPINRNEIDTHSSLKQPHNIDIAELVQPEIVS
jgi:hypothetical protein